MENVEIERQPSEKENKNKADLPVISFSRQEEWRLWLEENLLELKGIWLKIYKKGSGIVSINYDEALDEALCFGWIDGQKKKYDEVSYIQKFTPRRARSNWSKRNIEHVARLDKEGKMRLSGLKQVEEAKADGRWARAYDSPANMEIPEDFLQELIKDKNASSFFDSLSRANRYAIAWRLQTAKRPETRESRKKAILEMLSRGEKFH